MPNPLAKYTHLPQNLTRESHSVRSPKPSKLAAASEAMADILTRTDAARTNLTVFYSMGFNPIGLLNNPDVQCAALLATVDELQEAIRRLKATDWPTTKDVAKL